jgi:hypothetical protein
MRGARALLWWFVVAGCTEADAIGPDAGMVDAMLDAAGTPDAPGDPTAAELLAALTACDQAVGVGGPFAADSGGPRDISICALPTAVFWTADLDVDCDGKTTTACNTESDPSYLDETATTDSMGDPLDAAALPFVVVPVASARFDYRDAGLGLGSVAAVIYDGRVEYGVIGDLGPSTIIGEASYRMAELLGIDPDPATGGAEEGVTYIAFTGATAEVTTMEDHAEAAAIGLAHARALLGR